MTINSVNIDEMPDSISFRIQLKDDPLTDAQKKKIKEFVDEHLLKNETEAFDRNGALIHRKIDRLEGKSELFKALRKTYNTSSSQEAKSKLGFHYDTIQQALSDPSKIADNVGLDKDSKQQIFAAQKMIKAAIYRIEQKVDYTKMLKIYSDKMITRPQEIAEDSRTRISVKNQLLMNNDPIRKLDLSKTNPTALDFLLANSYFDLPYIDKSLPDGEVRQQARQLYELELTKLWQCEETRFVIEALAVLIQKEKGQFFFSDCEDILSNLGSPYKADYSGGVYTHHHSVYSCSLIKKKENELNSSYYEANKESRGAFIHEAQHFLFDFIVKNKSSPVNAGSDEEKIYDAAIKKDLEHIKTLIQPDQLLNLRVWRISGRNPGKLQELKISEEVARVLLTFDAMNYYQEDPASGIFLQDVLRAEAIVRIIQLLAEGISNDDVRHVMPNIHEFYFKYAKPRIEEFIINA